MAAFGTKKKGGDVAVQLTFPQVFQSVYNHPSMFYPQDRGGALDVMVGHDFQSNYHEQKRQEANRSVMNGLQARKTQEQLLLTGHQNYHVPKPVLTQRQFANPSLGAAIFSSSRRDESDAPFRLTSLTGGVLRTAEGQGYIQRKRMERLAQLNKIEALVQGQTVSSSGPMRGEADTPLEQLTIQFNLLRQSLLDDLVTGAITRFSYDNMKQLMDVLFKLGPIADRTTLEDVLAGFDTMLTLIRSLVDTQQQDNLAENAIAQDTLLVLMEKARQYTVIMIRDETRQPKDRLTASKSAIRSLKFGSLLKQTAQQALQDAHRDGALDQRQDQAYQNDDDDDDGDLGRPARAREDEEQPGIGRQPLAGVGFDENRILFGERSGRYLPGGGGEVRAPSFIEPLSEAPAEETEAQMEEFDEVEAQNEAEMELLENIGYREGVDPEPLIRQAYGGEQDDGRDAFLDAVMERVEDKRQRFEAAQKTAARGTPTPLRLQQDEQEGRRIRPGAAQSSRAMAQTPRTQTTLPQTREEFDQITSTEEGVRMLASRLGYQPRAGTKVGTIKTNLLRMLREAGVNLVRGYTPRKG